MIKQIKIKMENKKGKLTKEDIEEIIKEAEKGGNELNKEVAASLIKKYQKQYKTKAQLKRIIAKKIKKDVIDRKKVDLKRINKLIEKLDREDKIKIRKSKKAEIKKVLMKIKRNVFTKSKEWQREQTSPDLFFKSVRDEILQNLEEGIRIDYQNQPDLFISPIKNQSQQFFSKYN